MLGPEQVFLNIGDTLHEEANSVENHACDISACAEIWLTVLSDLWTIQKGDRKRHRPDPKHLEYPEAEKFEEVVALVVKSIVFACLQDAEQQKA